MALKCRDWISTIGHAMQKNSMALLWYYLGVKVSEQRILYTFFVILKPYFTYWAMSLAIQILLGGWWHISLQYYTLKKHFNHHFKLNFEFLTAIVDNDKSFNLTILKDLTGYHVIQSREVSNKVSKNFVSHGWKGNIFSLLCFVWTSDKGSQWVE